MYCICINHVIVFDIYHSLCLSRKKKTTTTKKLVLTFNLSWSKCECLHKKKCLCKNVILEILDHQMISNNNTPNSEEQRPFWIYKVLLHTLRHTHGKREISINPLFSWRLPILYVQHCSIMKTVFWKLRSAATLHYVATTSSICLFFPPVF